MPRYSAEARAKIAATMREFKQGTLRSGSGAKVTDPGQALAIAIAKAREAGLKLPAKPEEG